MNFIATAFSAYRVLPQIQRLYALLTPLLADAQKDLPEIVELVPKVQRFYELIKPIIEDFKSVAPEVVPLLKEVMNAVAPEAMAKAKPAAIKHPDFNVKWLQQSLNDLGYGPITADGDLGNETKEAVKKFQKANPPLTVDGWAGVETSAALYAKLTENQRAHT